ncbi:MAG: ABC transporter permease [Solirubrobacterales bacterium]
MRLAVAEMRRAKLRFGLLTGAVALLVFLILFMQTLSSQLIQEFVGGVENQSASVLVYGEDARRSIEGSIVSREQVTLVAAVDGVSEAAAFGENTFTVRTTMGELKDATIFGYELGGPGAPTTLSAGRLPDGPAEGVGPSDAGAGFGIGDRVEVLPGGYTIEIVGLADEVSFNVQPTMFVSYPTYEASVRSQNPDARAVLPTLVAVDPEPGVAPETLAARITAQVPGVEALDLETAVASLPGVSSVRQSFGLILALAFFVVVLVTGFFFLIITVQKAQALTLLRAVGASTGYLLRNLLLQVAVVTTVGTVIASGLLVLAAATSNAGFQVRTDPVLILETGGAVLLLAVIASIGSIRRVARLDPAAATARGVGGGLA